MKIERELPHVGGSVRGEPEHVAQVLEIDARFARNEALSTADLRNLGVKAAHPDDGWVNHDRNSVIFEYPQFNDGAGVGDLVALGWPWRGYRLVRLTGVDEQRSSTLFGMKAWLFEEVEMERCSDCGQPIELVGYDSHSGLRIERCGCCAPLPTYRKHPAPTPGWAAFVFILFVLLVIGTSLHAC